MKIPCLIIAYSRIDGISRLLSSLNPTEISKIYLAIDGPKADSEASIQTEINIEVEKFCNRRGVAFKLWQRNENLGVAKSIISAVDWFYINEEFGVILEDDLVIGDSFLKFINKNRNLLNNTDDLLLISGNQFNQASHPKYSLNWTNYPLIWGWATTRDKWLVMKQGILDHNLNLVVRPFSKVENFWRVGTLRVRSGYLDTWDIPLAYFMLANNKFCLTPDSNLVSNRGNDQFASHTLTNEYPLNLPASTSRECGVNSVPDVRDVDQYNKFLESKIFNIRSRHKFIYLYYIAFNVMPPWKNWKKLSESVNRVSIPKDI